MTISSESEANMANINGVGGSMEILKVNVSKGEDVDDSVFARFYALNDDNPHGNSNCVETLKKKENNSFLENNQKKHCYCLRKFLCCFQKEPETEEQYYSQL